VSFFIVLLIFLAYLASGLRPIRRLAQRRRDPRDGVAHVLVTSGNAAVH
jgi:hypothetical protein